LAGVHTSRTSKQGSSINLRIPKALWDEMGWRTGDITVLRWTGKLLIAERMPAEKLAIVGISQNGTGVNG
jgi:antitoxin component of MazEF toxin-antitoxin module